MLTDGRREKERELTDCCSYLLVDDSGCTSIQTDDWVFF